jgi:hypothetical protein
LNQACSQKKILSLILLTIFPVVIKAGHEFLLKRTPDPLGKNPSFRNHAEHHRRFRGISYRPKTSRQCDEWGLSLSSLPHTQLARMNSPHPREKIPASCLGKKSRTETL